MKRLFLYLLVGLLILVIFFSPLRNFLNNLVRHSWVKDNSELEILGRVSGYNPRVEQIQKILKKANFYPGLIDGVMGQATRKAIRDFQRENGLNPTGKIDSLTMLALNREAERERSDVESVQKEFKILPAQTEELKQKEESKKQLNKEYSATYLKTQEGIKEIQRALKQAGFYKGKIDGKIGPRTKKAIREFQKANKLKPDGIVGSKTWKQLISYIPDSY